MTGKRSLSLLVVAASFLMLLAYSPPRAGAGNEEVLAALEQAFDLVPEDGRLIDAETVYARIRSGKKDFVIVDVRPHAEDFEAGHIPGALYIPWREIVKEDSLKKLPRDRDIILCDSTGPLANQALLALRLLGYKAFALRWGMLSWSETRLTKESLGQINKGGKTGYPVEKGMDARLREERKRKNLEHLGC